jgi:hypothetical protein
MIVVRHERIRNKLNGRPITIFAKTSKEKSIILRFEEYPMTVVSTIVNMVIVVGKEFHDQHNWVAGRSPSHVEVRFLTELELGEKTDFYRVPRRRTSTGCREDGHLHDGR